jgi:hypothetical protein
MAFLLGDLVRHKSNADAILVVTELPIKDVNDKYTVNRYCKTDSQCKSSTCYEFELEAYVAP